MQEPCWTNVRQSSPPIGIPTWIENAQEFLDEPGEWFVDSQNILSYFPQPGETPDNTTSYLAHAITNPIAFVGTQTQPVQYINLKNLTISHGTVDYYNFNRSAIFIKYAQYLNFDHLKIEATGGNGIALNEGSQHLTITNSRFSQIGAHGILLIPHATVTPTNITDQDKINQILIDNNYLHSVGQVYRVSKGILAGYITNTSITHNTLTNLPASGISLGWGYWSNNTPYSDNNYVANNLVTNHLQHLREGGGIYTHSANPNTVIEKNVVLDQHNAIAGIYLDDFSQYLTITKNIVFNNPRSIWAKGGSHQIFDNYWQERWLEHGETPPPLPPFTDRTFPDIGINQKSDCGDSHDQDCGPNQVENNHPISSLSEAPQEVLIQAGVTCPKRKELDIPSLIPGISSSCPDQVLGDLNSDNHLDLFDYNVFVKNYGLTEYPGFISADFNFDGTVNLLDYNLFFNHYSQ